MSGSFGLTLGTIMVSIAFVMELTMFPLLLTDIQSTMSLSVGQLAWIFNAYAIAVAVAVLSAGGLGDLVHKRLVFTVGVSMFVLGSALSALSDTFLHLMLARGLQGFGGGLFSPLVPVILIQANSQQSGKTLMLWGGTIGVAAAFLPLFGGAILAMFGWRAVFAIFAVFAGIGLIIFLRDPLESGHASRSLPSYRRFFKTGGSWLLLGYIFLTYGSFSFYMFKFPILWSHEGYSGQSISILLTCVWGTFAILSFALKDKIDGKGLFRCLWSAPILLGIGFAVGAGGQHAFMLQVVSAVLMGASLACSNSPSTHLLLKLAPPDLRALTSSLDITFARVGSVVTVAALSLMSGALATATVIALCLLATLKLALVLQGLERPDKTFAHVSN